MLKQLLVFWMLVCTLQLLNAKVTRVLTVGFDNQYPPYEFTGEDGKVKGSNVDIVRAIALLQQ
jgi:ABC-type amino acid transport substrate-binding protein